MNDTIAKVLIELNSLFDESLSLQAISDRFYEINNKFLLPLAIIVKIRHTKEFGIDEELNSILEARRALKYDYKQSMLLDEQQKDLIRKKGITEATLIRIEPSGFVYEDSQIVAYLNPINDNEELIGHLIRKNRDLPK